MRFEQLMTILLITELKTGLRSSSDRVMYPSQIPRLGSLSPLTPNLERYSFVVPLNIGLTYSTKSNLNVVSSCWRLRTHISLEGINDVLNDVWIDVRRPWEPSFKHLLGCTVDKDASRLIEISVRVQSSHEDIVDGNKGSTCIHSPGQVSFRLSGLVEMQR